MLNQRLLAALLAVTTVTTTVAINTSSTYGSLGTKVPANSNGSENVQDIAQVDEIRAIFSSLGNFSDALGTVVDAIEAAKTGHEFFNNLKDLWEWLDNEIKQIRNPSKADIEYIIYSSQFEELRGIINSGEFRESLNRIRARTEARRLEETRELLLEDIRSFGRRRS